MPRETVAAKRERAIEIARRMNERYPKAECALHYDGEPFRLVIAVLLSAQTTDKGVNKVTPALYQWFPTLESFAEADPKEVGEYIHSCGFYNGKARDIVACANVLLEKHGGQLPRTMEELTALPGVGRKTANLILGDVFKIPGSTVVDTHCIRISNRLGLVDNLKDPVKIEMELRKILPPEHSSDFCHCIVLHGRAVCDARKPDCAACCLKHLCQTFSG